MSQKKWKDKLREGQERCGLKKIVAGDRENWRKKRKRLLIGKNLCEEVSETKEEEETEKLGNHMLEIEEDIPKTSGEIT